MATQVIGQLFLLNKLALQQASNRVGLLFDKLFYTVFMSDMPMK